MLNRRQLLRYGLAGAAVLLPGRTRAVTPTPPNPARCDLDAGWSVTPASARSLAADLPLRLPPVATPVDRDATTDRYRLVMRPAQVEILPGSRTTVWGYDGRYPGPTVRAEVGRMVAVEHVNELGEPTSVHLHGGRTPAEMDGHPLDLIAPGTAKTYRYPNRQPAATLWYHDHAMHRTAEHVYRGLAGFYLLTDEQEAELGLPSRDRDLPLMIQDRTFAADGSLVYRDDGHAGFIGDTVLVNGVPHPHLRVDAAAYRLRLLNASNARSYRLGLADGRPLIVVAGDGGLLPAPVPVPAVTLAPAERVELVVDFAGDQPGSSVLLTELPAIDGEPGILRFDVAGQSGEPLRLAGSLRPDEPVADAAVTRDVTLDRDAAGTWLLNGRGFEPGRFDAHPRLGATERWRLTNTTTMSHPVHLHLAMFHVLGRRRAGRPPEPPTPEESGWKDTVRVGPGETVEVAVDFAGYPGTFVYHCHVLEHEDHDMMAQFRVIEVARLAGPGRLETAAAVSEATFPEPTAVAFVATAAGFADALAGGPAAAAEGGPVLLTSGATLSAVTAAELRRLRPARVVVLGGPAAVADTVVAALAAHSTGAVTRAAGVSRYATAAAVSRAFFAPGVPVAYVATGDAFPDALAGGAAAAAEGGPVLLATRDALPDVTAAELGRLRPARIVALGGRSALSDGLLTELRAYGPVQRLAGADRFDTAAAVCRAVFATPTETVFVATGRAYPDALAGVPAAGRHGAPLLLVEHDRVPPPTADELRRLGPARVVILGGPAAVSEAVRAQLEALIDASDPRPRSV